MTYHWTEHEDLNAIDTEVADKFERDVTQAFSSAAPNAENLKTYKEEILEWLKDRIFDWQEVLRMVEALPDDENQDYEESEEEDEV